MKSLLTVSAALIATMFAGATSAQQPDQPRQPPGRAGGFIGGGLLRALDTDGDRELSAEEIANAGKSLAKLDRDGNGKLTSEELRPPRPPRPDADTIVARYLEQFDKNGDGKVAGDEITDRMRSFAERVDTDDDGALTKEELKKYYSERPGFGGPGAFVARFFEQNDKNGDGKLSGDEITDRMKRLVENLDSDADGVLTKEEMTKGVEAGRLRRGGRGGRGGRPARPDSDTQGQ